MTKAKLKFTSSPANTPSRTCPLICRRSVPSPAFAQAVLAGNWDVARLLRAAGAEVDPVEEEGGSLLREAARRGLLSAVELLLELGASPQGVDLAEGGMARHDAPLLLASRQGHAEVVAALLGAGADPGRAGADGRTALQSAAAGGHQRVVRSLISAGAAPDAGGLEEDRAPPLLLATRAGHHDTVDVLLGAGATVDAANRHGVTALMVAAFACDEALVARLLAAGADPALRNRAGHTPLHFASIRPHQETVARLLAAGADPDASTWIEAFGEVTPLMLAAGRGHLELTRLLLAHGASPETYSDLQGFGRVTPREVAQRRGYAEIAALLGRSASPGVGVEPPGR